jgi:hypothetical protein
MIRTCRPGLGSNGFFVIQESDACSRRKLKLPSTFYAPSRLPHMWGLSFYADSATVLMTSILLYTHVENISQHRIA